MLGWFNTIKEKQLDFSLFEQSKEVAQLYKNELTNMVYQLDDDIKTLKHNIGTNKEEQDDNQISQEMSSLKQEKEVDQTSSKSQLEQKQQVKKNIIALLEIIQEYDKEIQNNQDNIEFLNEQIEFIENNLDSYFAKDPKQLVMIERDDFTNFHVFEEIPHIEQQALRLLTVNVFKNLTKDIKILKRVLYFLIYQFHEKVQYSLDQQNNNSTQNESNNKKSDEILEQDNNQFLKETENANIISQDSIEEQDDGSNTKSQRKKSSASKSQEEDNWEFDDKMIAI